MNKILDPLVTLAVIFVCIVFLVLFLCAKEPKASLAEHYSVSRKTLLKWVQYFPCSIDMDVWKRIRKLPRYEMEKIKQEWGSDKSFVMSKKQMANKLGETYKSLSKKVKGKLDELGLTLEAWERCSIFPPVICKRIMEII